MRRIVRRLLGATAALLLLFSTAAANGASIASVFTSGTGPLIRKYCGDCHSGKHAEGRLDLVQLTASPSFSTRFKSWEKVINVLQKRKMPPKSADQPNDRERKAISQSIKAMLEDFVRKNAGDPGPVVMRRLTSAEYAYTIQDLTGLDLSLEKVFINDAVGGEGFTNVGRVQFMQDSALERYLEAAKTVASHAVIGAGPLDFFSDPGQTGLELSAIWRIQQIYRRHGFRTSAGEGAEPYGLDTYPRGFYVAWQYRHRKVLGLSNTSLAKLAKTEQLSARFAEHIWTVLNGPRESFPISLVQSQWRALPIPNRDRENAKRKARAGCDDIYRAMRNWQTALAAATGDEEEAAVLTAGELNVRPAHRFKANLDWEAGSKTATIDLSVTPATNQATRNTSVVWKNARIRFRQDDKRWLAPRPLRDVLIEKSRQQLKFGRHPSGHTLGKDDFVLSSPANLSLEINVPARAIRGQLFVDVELDRQRGSGTPVRCTISDGIVEGETIAASGGHSALLADPEAASHDAWKRGVSKFARQLPEVSHREPAPSDRDPIPAPFDNTYNSTERNLFHYRIKYHRDDDFLVKYLLDDATRKRLDDAWADLHMSFEFHDAWLDFVARKFKLGITSKTISELDRKTIDRLPPTPRRLVLQLRESFIGSRQRLRAAQPGHVDDALRFAERAWRRPLTTEEKNRLRSFYNSLRQKSGLNHTKAIRTLLARILVSPAFLYRVEPPQKRTGIVPLSDRELASRLSYFLWSSVPDAELQRVADAGRLKDPDELARQARRMLRDRKARRFATEFFGQWFGFYRFDQYRGIDTKRFPEFTDGLKAAMYDEAVSFFAHIVRNDRPVREVLFADYAFLNRQLATHYRIDVKKISVNRPELVKNLNSHHRGGLLRLGAVLTVTSAPLRTSPVKRGDWILRRVLGTPVPPPPPDAGSIPADDVLSDGKTVRERLIAHRREASCANCHSRIDPLGFALENFDPLGRWRDRYRDKQPVAPGGTLNDGTKITGPDGLRRYLQKNEMQFHRTLCAKLLGYALGRTEIASDRPLIEQMTADLKNNDNRFSQLVVRIVTSRQFRYQRGTETSKAPSPGASSHRKGRGDDER